MIAALEVENLAVAYGGDPAVSVAHLALPRGSLAGGQPGSGVGAQRGGHLSGQADVPALGLRYWILHPLSFR